MKANKEQEYEPNDPVSANAMPASAEDLLEVVKCFRAVTGDSLTDEEFTFLLLGKHLLAEAGFHFLCFHNGCVTLSVPRQDDESWRPAERWISPEKERIAACLANKYGLMLTEPPDAALRWIVPNGMAVRHHLQLSNRKETIVIAHPEFLKIRLYASDTGLILPPVRGFLKDLAALYETVILPELAACFQTNQA